MSSFNEVFIDQLKAKVKRGMDDAFVRGENIQPPGRGPTASSNSRRLTSWIGWPISCRHFSAAASLKRRIDELPVIDIHSL